MKKYLAACVFMISGFVPECQAQFAWYNNYQGNSYTWMGKLAIDKNGSLFTIGGFSNDVTIADTRLSGYGSFLMKLAPSGDLVWYKRFGYSHDLFTGVSYIKTDGSGNVYVIGQFPFSATLGATVITGHEHNSFLAKFNTNGDLLWVRRFIQLQEIFHMAVNDAGDIGITGPFFNSVNMDNATILTSHRNTFGALFDTNGNLVWAQVFGSNAAFTTYPISLALDPSGNFFLCGRYAGLVTIGGKTISAAGTGNYNVYFSKINKQGECEWLVPAFRTAPANYESTDPFSTVMELADMTTDPDGNLYATGTLWIDMKIGDQHLLSNQAQPENFYALKLDPNGNVVWIKPTIIDGSRNICENVVFKNNKLFYSGLYNGAPFYMVREPQSGDVIKDITTVPLNGDILNGLAIDDSEDVYMSGRIPWNGYNKGFVFKIGTAAPQVGEAEAVLSADFICTDGTLAASTSPIMNAESYEWQVTCNGIVTMYQTTLPAIDIPLNDLNAASKIEIRVRGISADDIGEYSDSKFVQVNYPGNKPELEIVCNEIRALKGMSITWYKDDILIPIENTTTLIAPEKGTYHVIDQNACGNSKSEAVEFAPIFIPNIITPNGDLLNDAFILDERLSGSTLTIINRWGNNIFSTDAYENNWNGFDEAAGIYFYHITHSCFVKPVQGSLTVSR